MFRSLLACAAFTLGLAAVAAADAPEAAGPAFDRPVRDTLPLALDDYFRREEMRPGELRYLSSGEPHQVNSIVDIFGEALPRIGVWRADLEGSVRSGIGGDLISLSQDLDIHETEDGFITSGQIGLGSLALRYSFFSTEFEGSNVLTRTFSFSGQDFTVSQQVDTKLKIQNAGLNLAIPLFQPKPFSFYLEVGVQYYSLEGELTAAGQPTISDKDELPFPVIGVVVRAEFGRFFIEGEVMGLDVDIGSVNGRLIDASVSVGVRFLHIFVARAGWRLVDISANFDDFEVDLELNGLYASIGISF
ncbi:MAG: hypothetical protein V3T86_04595 [Planctomycetota bacterium]